MHRAKPSDGIAWVTGASSGIGRAAALELARRGWRVALTARRVAELDALAAEIVRRLVPEEIDEPDLLDGAVPFTPRQVALVDGTFVGNASGL